MTIQRPCFLCDGTGMKCSCCGESSAVCDGSCEDGPHDQIDCVECEGTGIASADLHAMKEKEAKKKEQAKKRRKK